MAVSAAVNGSPDASAGAETHRHPEAASESKLLRHSHMGKNHPPVSVSVRHISVQSPRHLKVMAGSPLRSGKRRSLHHPAPDRSNPECMLKEIRGTERPLPRRHQKTVRKRRTEIIRFADSLQPRGKRRHAPYVPRIAVRVPSSGIDNAHAAEEIAPPVSPTHDHHGVVRKHVAVAAVNGIAVCLPDAFKGVLPVAVLLRPGADGAVDLRNHAVRGNDGHSDVEKTLHILFLESGGNHRRHHLRGIDRLPVVRDRCRPARKLRRKTRIPGSNHPPHINENLPPDLFGDFPPVQFRRSRTRRGDPVLQTQKRRMFRGMRHAPPPENRLTLQQIIEPGLPVEVLRRVFIESRILQSADESERAGDVVIRHGDGRVPLGVMVENAVFLLDHLFGPPFLTFPEIHSDPFAQKGRVHLFFIVLHHRHTAKRSFCNRLIRCFFLLQTPCVCDTLTHFQEQIIAEKGKNRAKPTFSKFSTQLRTHPARSGFPGKSFFPRPAAGKDRIPPSA